MTFTFATLSSTISTWSGEAWLLLPGREDVRLIIEFFDFDLSSLWWANWDILSDFGVASYSSNPKEPTDYLFPNETSLPIESELFDLLAFGDAERS